MLQLTQSFEDQSSRGARQYQPPRLYQRWLQVGATHTEGDIQNKMSSTAVGSTQQDVRKFLDQFNNSIADIKYYADLKKLAGELEYQGLDVELIQRRFLDSGLANQSLHNSGWRLQPLFNSDCYEDGRWPLMFAVPFHDQFSELFRRTLYVGRI